MKSQSLVSKKRKKNVLSAGIFALHLSIKSVQEMYIILLAHTVNGPYCMLALSTLACPEQEYMYLLRYVLWKNKE